MFLEKYDISVFDKAIQDILIQLNSLNDISFIKENGVQIVFDETKKDEFSVYTTENGQKTDSLDGRFSIKYKHCIIDFRGTNGKFYRYSKGYSKPIMEVRNFNGSIRTIKEKTVINQLKAYIKDFIEFERDLYELKKRASK